MNLSWQLQNNGTYTPVHDLFISNVNNIDSDVAIALFMLKAGAADSEIYEAVIDAWSAYLIEEHISYDAGKAEILKALKSELADKLQQFEHTVPVTAVLRIHAQRNKYNNIDELYDYIDFLNMGQACKLHTALMISYHHQFCQVHYETGTKENCSSISFMINSTCFRWEPVLYKFLQDICKTVDIDFVSVYRDPAADNIFVGSKYPMFYKGDSNILYKNIKIPEFLSDIQNYKIDLSATTYISEGVVASVKIDLVKGRTFESVLSKLQNLGLVVPERLPARVWSQLIAQERSDRCSR